MTRIALIAGLASAAALSMSAFTAQAAPFSPTTPVSVAAKSVEQVHYRGGYHHRPVVIAPFYRGGHRGWHHGYGRRW